MNRLANVLLLSRDPRSSEALTTVLSANRCTSLLCDEPASFLARALSDHPDLAMIDVTSMDEDGLNAAQTLRGAFGNRQRPDHLADAGIVGGRCSIGRRRSALTMCSGCLSSRKNSCTAFRPLLRLSTMHAEMDRRIELARKYDLEVEHPQEDTDDTPFRILMASAGALTSSAVKSALSGPCDFTVCDSLEDAEDLLWDRFFDACILCVPQEFDHAPFGHLNFCNQVRNNPRLFNLPIIVTAPLGEFSEIDQPFFKHGATRVFRGEIAPESLRFALVSLVSRQRKRWQMRLALEATRTGNTKDPSTGTYVFPFLESHLGHLIDTARTWQKHLSVVSPSIFPNVNNVRREFGDDAGNHLMQQLGQWITGLIRAEDMVARHGEHDFCVAFPDTPMEEANAVMHRVAGVVSYTDFAVRNVYQPISVWVEMGIAELQPDDSVSTLLARARRKPRLTRSVSPYPSDPRTRCRSTSSSIRFAPGAISASGAWNRP